jgi:hypothetical protein
MSGIPEATPIRLTWEGRTELEALARSTKTERRLRQRARIVALAASGEATRAIARAAHCTKRPAEEADAEKLQRIPSSRTIARIGRNNLSKAETATITAVETGYDGGYDAVRRYAGRWAKDRGHATAAAYVPLSFHNQHDRKDEPW